jgi:predicted RNA-binding Zn-ribbon protein involved in translation (DUF1610 family)
LDYRVDVGDPVLDRGGVMAHVVTRRHKARAQRERMMARRLPNGLSLNDVQVSAAADEHLGYCLSCGAEAYGVEPNARRYPCDACGTDRVYGAEEILIMFA